MVKAWELVNMIIIPVQKCFGTHCECTDVGPGGTLMRPFPYMNVYYGNNFQGFLQHMRLWENGYSVFHSTYLRIVSDWHAPVLKMDIRVKCDVEYDGNNRFSIIASAQNAYLVRLIIITKFLN